MILSCSSVAFYQGFDHLSLDAEQAGYISNIYLSLLIVQISYIVYFTLNSSHFLKFWQTLTLVTFNGNLRKEFPENRLTNNYTDRQITTCLFMSFLISLQLYQFISDIQQSKIYFSTFSQFIKIADLRSDWLE